MSANTTKHQHEIDLKPEFVSICNRAEVDIVEAINEMIDFVIALDEFGTEFKDFLQQCEK